MDTDTCPGCDKPFTKKRSFQIYCSKECRAKVYSARRDRMRELMELERKGKLKITERSDGGKDSPTDQ